MPPKTVSTTKASVKQRIVDYLVRVPFERAIEQDDFEKLLEEDAKTAHPLYTAEAIAALKQARDLRKVKRANPAPSLFISNKSVLIVPGFLGESVARRRASRQRLDLDRPDALCHFQPTIERTLRVATGALRRWPTGPRSRSSFHCR